MGCNILKKKKRISQKDAANARRFCLISPPSSTPLHSPTCKTQKLQSVKRLDAQDVKRSSERESRGVAKNQPRLLLFGAHHLARAVKLVERDAQVVRVVAQARRKKLLHQRVDGVGKLQDGERQRLLLVAESVVHSFVQWRSTQEAGSTCRPFVRSMALHSRGARSTCGYRCYNIRGGGSYEWWWWWC